MTTYSRRNLLRASRSQRIVSAASASMLALISLIATADTSNASPSPSNAHAAIALATSCSTVGRAWLGRQSASVNAGSGFSASFLASASTHSTNTRPTHLTTGFLADRAARRLPNVCGGSADTTETISTDAAAITKRMGHSIRLTYRDYEGRHRRHQGETDQDRWERQDNRLKRDRDDEYRYREWEDRQRGQRRWWYDPEPSHPRDVPMPGKGNLWGRGRW